MGACSSKRKNWKVLKRISEYEKAAREEYEGLEKIPISLDCEPPDNITGCGQISLKKFHNMFYDGFYAPFLKNPLYLLVIDCRDEDAFSESHVAAARWHGHLNFTERNFDFVKFGVIILYDYDGTGFSTPGSQFNKVYEHLKSRRFEPLILVGGYEAINSSCPYMLTDNQFPVRERSITVHWYPLMIQESTLYLGRADQALNPAILGTLRITHIVCLTETIPVGIFRSINYLICPINDSDDKTDLIDKITNILDFMRDAIQKKGRILVHCDQGVNRGPAVIMAYLMTTLLCTLEDAFYYLKQLRRVLMPSDNMLKQLLDYEEKVFGKKLTVLDDLWTY